MPKGKKCKKVCKTFPKWGKIGAPKSAKRKAWMKKIAKKKRK